MAGAGFRDFPTLGLFVEFDVGDAPGLELAEFVELQGVMVEGGEFARW